MKTKALSYLKIKINNIVILAAHLLTLIGTLNRKQLSVRQN